MARRPEIVTAGDYGRTVLDGHRPIHGVQRNDHSECNKPARGSPVRFGSARRGGLGRLQDALEITHYGSFVDVIVHADRLPDTMLNQIQPQTPRLPQQVLRSTSFVPPPPPPPQSYGPNGRFPTDPPRRGTDPWSHLDYDLPVTTVFGKSNLKEYSPTSFPWNTIGRVAKGSIAASGAFVSPTMVISSNHVVSSFLAQKQIQVLDEQKVLNLMFYPGSSTIFQCPFSCTKLPVIGIVRWLDTIKNDTSTPHEQAFDYAYLQVDLKGAKSFKHPGWMEPAMYHSKWVNLNMWSICGYPEPGKYTPDGFESWDPVVHEKGAIMGHQWKGDKLKGLRLFHGMDVLVGMSGGPIFGWPFGPVGLPQIIGIQSTHGSGGVVGTEAFPKSV